MRKYIVRFIIVLLIGLNITQVAISAPIKNVILCIGDGMGKEQIKAASCYLGTNLFFESFPYKSMMSTDDASGNTVDSAASGTAIATGEKVYNGVVSLQIPGDNRELETLLEYFIRKGKSTGMVTSSHITHATPATFAAHTSHRNNYDEIADDYLNNSKPNILFGGGGKGMSVSDAITAGYSIITDSTELTELNTQNETFVSGQFGSGHLPYEIDGLGNLPHLHEMTQVALDVLDNDPDGFFLMLEGARIDHAGHGNNLPELIHEVIEFSKSVETIHEWMGERQDTLIIVTADHETGGLDVTKDNGAGNYPEVHWGTTGHTSTKVPVYAVGMKANIITNITDNTHVHDVLISKHNIIYENGIICVGDEM